MLRESVYDAMLLDLRMPGIDGIEVLKWMRTEGFRLPVIIISAHGDITDAVTALKQGAQDYIVKPFNPEEIVLRIKSIVETASLRNIAENSDSEIDKILDASQGQFTIDNRDDNTPYIKKLRVVTTVTYSLKD